MNTRIFNIIERAEKDFGYTYDMEDTLQDILDQAENTIRENVEYDRIDVCERGRHYDSIDWTDGKGYVLNACGEFISTDDSKNTYFRRDENGKFHKIEWFEHTEDDYILMDYDIDTDGQLVALISQ